MYKKICVTSEKVRKVTSLDAVNGEVVGDVVLKRLQRLAGIDFNEKLERLIVAGWNKLEEIDLEGKTTCMIENTGFTDIHTVLYTSDNTFLVACARGTGHHADCVIEVDRRGNELFRWRAGDKYDGTIHLNSATPTKNGFLVSLRYKRKIVEISREGEVLKEIDLPYFEDIHPHASGLHNPVMRDGKIWFSGGNAIYVIDDEGNILDKFEKFSNPKGLDFWGSKVLVAENHAHRVSIIDLDSGEIKRFPVNKYPFRAVWVKDTFFSGDERPAELEKEVHDRLKSLGYLGE